MPLQEEVDQKQATYDETKAELDTQVEAENESKTERDYYMTFYSSKYEYDGEKSIRSVNSQVSQF